MKLSSVDDLRRLPNGTVFQTREDHPAPRYRGLKWVKWHEDAIFSLHHYTRLGLNQDVSFSLSHFNDPLPAKVLSLGKPGAEYTLRMTNDPNGEHAVNWSGMKEME